jgi:DNA-binding Lrp family transcriptional regulator
MIVGYVLITTKPGQERNVLSEINKLDRVDEAYALFGEYDIIAKLMAKDYNDLSRIVIRFIRSIPGVLDTETLAGVDIIK